MVENALSKPRSIACAKLLPSRSLSLILSKMSTFVSTAMPTVSTRPAIPGKVKTAPGINASRPNNSTIFDRSATLAIQPKRRYQSPINSNVNAIPKAKAAKPLVMFSSPKLGPMVRSSTIVTGAVIEPALSKSASCCALA